MIELNPIFKPIFTTDKRYIILTGGRGSSKSFSVNTAAALTSYEAGHVFLHTRYAMNTAEDSIIPEFLEKLDMLEVRNDFMIRKADILNKVSGSSFMFRGIRTTSGDQTAKLKSLTGLTDWILDEAEELVDENKFDDIDLSVRSTSAQNRIILILNPTTMEHWIWKRWFEDWLTYVEIDGIQIPISSHPDILHIHTTFFDNIKNLRPDYVAQLRKIKFSNPKKYRHKVLGGWLEKAEGVIFEEWEEGEFNDMLPYCFGLDFGYSPDPIAMVKVAVDRKNKKIHLQERLYANELSTKEAVRRIEAAIDRKTDLIMCDTSEPRLYAALKAKKLNVAMVSKKRSGGDTFIKADIRDMHDYKIVVDPKSFNLKKEFNNYKWNDKRSSIPIDKWNHGIDGARYGFRRLVGYQKTRGMKQIN